MEKLSWYQLTDIIREYEDQHNYEQLKAFCAKYYPTATRVKVTSISEYDDNYNYNTFDQSSTHFCHEDERLRLADDGVGSGVAPALSGFSHSPNSLQRRQTRKRGAVAP